ncbi:MAG: Abi family protein, partial [Bacteroidaceae bacterium]|nr:Abi family protein [Bacteroidaceae bacterium]
INNSINPLKTFYDICIVKWFVDIISPNNDMKEHLLYLFRAFPNVDVKAMGFPYQWEQEPLWSK